VADSGDPILACRVAFSTSREIEQDIVRARSTGIRPEKFRAVLSQFCTGVVIVTTCDDAGPAGLTCQSFSALSMDPPLVLFCPAKTSKTWPRIEAAGSFCVNVLSEGQERLSARFATSGGPKFENVEWEAGQVGVPRLCGALAHVDCCLESVHDAGDHLMVVGRVVALDQVNDSRPLVFFRSDYVALSG